MKAIYIVLLSALIALSMTITPIRTANANQLTQTDFNGDGYADLMVGVPDEDVTTSGIVHITRIDAGAVNVL